MPDATITTISGCPNGLKAAFERAKEAAEDSRQGCAYLDPNGLGEGAYIVFADDEWDDWVESPKSVLDLSDMLVIPKQSFADAFAEQALADDGLSKGGMSVRLYQGAPLD